jgi:hypothetical protein
VELKQRLLETPADRVSPEIAKAVTGFCAPVGAIRSAYVGLLEITEGSDAPEQCLGVGFELTDAAATAAGDQELHLVATRFYDLMPEELQKGGCNFLESAGLAAWQQKAQRVFSRR